MLKYNFILDTVNVFLQEYSLFVSKNSFQIFWEINKDLKIALTFNRKKKLFDLEILFIVTQNTKECAYFTQIILRYLLFFLSIWTFKTSTGVDNHDYPLFTTFALLSPFEYLLIFSLILSNLHFLHAFLSKYWL